MAVLDCFGGEFNERQRYRRLPDLISLANSIPLPDWRLTIPKRILSLRNSSIFLIFPGKLGNASMRTASSFRAITFIFESNKTNPGPDFSVDTRDPL